MDWDSNKLADLGHNSRVGGLDLKLGEASSKRARGLGGSSVWCLVEGCGVDLSNGRDYNRRHKVCVVHSKTAVVLVGGQEMRFCQQCSRFHLLEEFDETKRSCRKRLDGHNRRRRKPQPECINSGGLFPNHQGTIFSSYPNILSSARADPSWSGIDKAEEDAGYTHRQTTHSIDRQRYFPSAFHSYKEAKQFPFSQDSDSAIERRMPLEYSSSSVSHLPQNSTTTESSNSRMFRNGLSQVLNSDCALSLLSSPIQSTGIELGQVMPSMSQSMVSSTQCSGFCQYSHSEYGGFGRYSNSEASNNVSRTGFSISDMEEDCGRLSKGFVSAEGSDAEDCSGFLHVAGEGSSDGPSRAFPFSWQ